MNAALERGLAAQRDAADPVRSVWVSANAGTGKTRVLVNRVLRLLLGGTRPGAILCLTFTKAAAAEMATRLHDELAKWAVADDGELAKNLAELSGRGLDADALVRARRLFATTLDAPGGLRIQTMHAFCQSLLGRFPLEAGVPPHFSVMDERRADEVALTARMGVLELAGRVGGPKPLADALELVASRTAEDTFAKLMRDLASKRSQLADVLRAHGDDVDRVIAASAAALGLDARDSADSLIAAVSAEASLDRKGLDRACLALDQGSDADRNRASGIRGWLGDPPRRTRRFESEYARIFVTKEGNAQTRLITQKAEKADPDAKRYLSAEQDRVLAALEKIRAARIAAGTAALWRLGAAMVEQYETAKLEAGLLDYDDLILKARSLLRTEGRTAWVLYKLDGGIDHILVDEAQDTSPEQWEIVARLAEEFFVGAGARGVNRTVFSVGDEKQSIYSFQGAEPANFSRMRAHFAQRIAEAKADFQPVELALSFRSTAPVLRAVDAVFARTPVAEHAISHAAEREGHAGIVEVWPIETEGPRTEADPWDAPVDQVAADSPVARAASRIAETVKGWLDGGETLEAEGRPIRPGDVLILVRRRNVFVEQMVRELKRRNVPVAGSDRMVLTEQIAVMDLIALGRFVLLPEDDLNLATVLKGPLFGFDDALLFDLAHGRHERLWRTLARRRDERPEFAAAHHMLASLRENADYVPPFEFYADVLGARGGRRALLARLGPDADDAIDEFQNLALVYQRAHPPSLEGFLHWVEVGEVEVKRDMDQGRDEVRVMTVHGAKGLESAIVFLPDTVAVPDGRLEPRLLWQHREQSSVGAEPPLFFWAPSASGDCAATSALRQAERVRRLAEHRRLLYVAMTRARDRLYVCGFAKEKAPEESWYAMVRDALEPLAESVPAPEGQRILRLSSPQTAEPKQRKERSLDAGESGLPAWASRPAPSEPAPSRPLAPSRMDGDEPSVASPLGPDQGARFQRGRIIHRLLQTLPDLPATERAPAAARYLSRREHRLNPETQARVAAEVLRLLGDPAVAALFGPGSMAEVPLVGAVGGYAVSGQVDRLLVTPQRVIVADYKSNRPPPRQLQDVPSIYLKQMALYRALLMKIYPGRPVDAVLVWTDGPIIMQLSVHILTPLAP
ncbi:MAG TPA: double-strand break repair helicase AddA [Candidatus Cybelea sp.]|nr:double-strand break repair helicase AddA [Candidatus Cybelea sp.]